MLIALLAGCTEAEPSPALPSEPLNVLTQTVQLAGADLGNDIIRWEPLTDRAIVIYSVRVCEEPECGSSVTTLHAVDERGEPWMIAELDEGADFGITDGTEVLLLSVDGNLVPIDVDSPAPVAPGSRDTGSARDGSEITGFSPHNLAAAVLGDGSYLIRGQWDHDEPMESWFEPMQGEGNSEPRRPIRLFFYEPATDLLTPISGIPSSSEVSTAVSSSFGPDTVLRVEVLPGDRVVAYSVGFNGAAYDNEHDLYLAPLPSP
jgi:hypothetical protein